MRVGKVFVMLAVLVATAFPALAQETTGTIKGRVVDAQGLAVPGATSSALATVTNMPSTLPAPAF